MDAIEAITQRVSVPKVQHPAPNGNQLQLIKMAALRAADHGNLRPWRFLEVSGKGLHALGRVYLEAALDADPGLNEAQKERFLGLPLRAPMVIVAIAKVQAHPKVPREEQLISAGCAVQNMLNAAFALNVGAYWRTGELALNPKVAASLGLSELEEIVGFLYLGSPSGEPKAAPQLNPDDFFSTWQSSV